MLSRVYFCRVLYYTRSFIAAGQARLACLRCRGRRRSDLCGEIRDDCNKQTKKVRGASIEEEDSQYDSWYTCTVE